MGVRVGDRIRPNGAMYYGTLGFFCQDNSGVIYLASCDHVINSLAPFDGDNGEIYFNVGNDYSLPIAEFAHQELVSESVRIADFAIARVVISVDSAVALPMKLPYSNISTFTGVCEPYNGGEVILWGARSCQYHSGVVLNSKSNYAWPHVRYGMISYEQQFSVAIDTSVIVDIGDSGGYVIDSNGRLMGIIAALSGYMSKSGNAIIHCVPVISCCKILNVSPIVGGR